jgi:hypothetical protein
LTKTFFSLEHQRNQLNKEAIRRNFQVLGEFCMDLYFQEGSVEVKRKIFSSIFPGKLIFENGKYRTEGLNPALALILRKKSELEKKEGGGMIISENTSADVPKIGLEPTYLSVPEPKSGVSTNSTTWAGAYELILVDSFPCGFFEETQWNDSSLKNLESLNCFVNKLKALANLTCTACS